jgi:hypothetical protein
MIWLVSNTKDLPDCALMFPTLFDKMIRSPKSSLRDYHYYLILTHYLYNITIEEDLERREVKHLTWIDQRVVED